MNHVDELRVQREAVGRCWVQGTPKITGEACLLWEMRGSLHGLRGEALALVERVVGTEDPVAWNDAAGRTKEEVLAVLDEAIALGEASQLRRVVRPTAGAFR